jgi:hypothetical protein
VVCLIIFLLGLGTREEFWKVLETGQNMGGLLDFLEAISLNVFPGACDSE